MNSCILFFMKCIPRMMDISENCLNQYKVYISFLVNTPTKYFSSFQTNGILQIRDMIQARL